MIIILFICCRWTWLPNSRKTVVLTRLRDIGLQVCFLMLSLGLVSWQYWPQNPLASVSSSFIFWKCLWRLWISSFYVWQTLSMKPRWAGLFFVARLLITNSASFLVICPFRLFILQSVLSNCLFLEFCPFHLRCLILSAQGINLSFVRSVLSLLFILDFGTLYRLCFFQLQVSQSVDIFNSSWFYWSFLFLFHWLLIFISFFLFTMGLVCSSLSGFIK